MLRNLAAKIGLLIGTVIQFWVDDPRYRSKAYAEFNTISPGIAFMWRFIEPQQNQFDFFAADEVINDSITHGVIPQGSTGMWDFENPPWLIALSPENRKAALRHHIRTVMRRYRGKIKTWVVVNEAFDLGGQLKDNLWLETSRRYIDLAFVYAKSADPSAELLYNDYGIEVINAKSDAVLQYLTDARLRGIPIDGIGMQFHVDLDSIDYVSFAKNIKRFRQAGFKVAITELDVRMPLPRTPAKTVLQAEVYANIFRVALEGGVRDITLWGFTDAYSWIPEFFPGWGDACLLNVEYKQKPAYLAVRDVLRSFAPDSIVGTSNGSKKVRD
jgi:endo-1,4-beta-xylanase